MFVVGFFVTRLQIDHMILDSLTEPHVLPLPLLRHQQVRRRARREHGERTVDNAFRCFASFKHGTPPRAFEQRTCPTNGAPTYLPIIDFLANRLSLDLKNMWYKDGVEALKEYICFSRTPQPGFWLPRHQKVYLKPTKQDPPLVSSPCKRARCSRRALPYRVSAQQAFVTPQ